MEEKKSIVDILVNIHGEPPMQTHRRILREFLPVLRLVHILNIVLMAFTVLIPTWEGFGIILAAASVGCYFALSSANSRYRTAGIFQVLYMLCLLLSTPLNNMGLLMLVSALLKLIADFQEYYAHAEMLERTDGGLAHSWRTLFNWYIVLLLIAMFFSFILTTLVLMLALDRITTFWISTYSLSIAAVTYLPELIVDIFYLIYLNRMIRYTKMEE